MKKDSRDKVLAQPYAATANIAFPLRRKFLKQSSLLAMSAAVGAHIPFRRFFPEGLLPVALAQAPDLKAYDKNAALIVLGDKPCR